MLARLAGLLVRVLLETALLLLVIAALLTVLAFRTSRRLVTSKDGRIDQIAGWAAPLLALLAAIQQSPARQDSDNTLWRGYDPG